MREQPRPLAASEEGDGEHDERKDQDVDVAALDPEHDGGRAKRESVKDGIARTCVAWQHRDGREQEDCRHEDPEHDSAPLPEPEERR